MTHIKLPVNREKLFDMPCREYTDFERVKKEFEGMNVVSFFLE